MHVTFGIQTENKVRSSFTIEIGDWLHFDFCCAAMLETFEMSKTKNNGNVKQQNCKIVKWGAPSRIGNPDSHLVQIPHRAAKRKLGAG